MNKHTLTHIMSDFQSWAEWADKNADAIAAKKINEDSPQEQFDKKIKELSDIVAKSLNTTFLGEQVSQKTRDRIVEECIKPCIDMNLYEIICDETNNTPEDIMNQKVVFDIKSKL